MAAHTVELALARQDTAVVLLTHDSGHLTNGTAAIQQQYNVPLWIGYKPHIGGEDEVITALIIDPLEAYKNLGWDPRSIPLLSALEGHDKSIGWQNVGAKTAAALGGCLNLYLADNPSVDPRTVDGALDSIDWLLNEKKLSTKQFLPSDASITFKDFVEIKKLQIIEGMAATLERIPPEFYDKNGEINMELLQRVLKGEIAWGRKNGMAIAKPFAPWARKLQRHLAAGGEALVADGFETEKLYKNVMPVRGGKKGYGKRWYYNQIGGTGTAIYVVRRPVWPVMVRKSQLLGSTSFYKLQLV